MWNFKNILLHAKTSILGACLIGFIFYKAENVQDYATGLPIIALGCFLLGIKDKLPK